MIKKLEHNNKEVAERILAIQLPAYQVEAKLMEFNALPPLKETVVSILKSNELFFGYFSKDKLVAIISYNQEEEYIEICRLVVDPNYFRKGIGKQLVKFIIQIADGKPIFVMTGTNNIPAVSLYTSIGFRKKEKIEIAPDVYVRKFVHQL